jgi:hypothetical protein
LALAREGAKEGDTLKSYLVSAQPAAAAATVRFPGSPKPTRMKELLRAWGVSPPLRARLLVIAVDAAPLALFDGASLVVPGRGGQKSQCSQEGLDLRYL